MLFAIRTVQLLVTHSARSTASVYRNLTEVPFSQWAVHPQVVVVAPLAKLPHQLAKQLPARAHPAVMGVIPLNPAQLQLQLQVVEMAEMAEMAETVAMAVKSLPALRLTLQRLFQVVAFLLDRLL
jgi:hypothetical protein